MGDFTRSSSSFAASEDPVAALPRVLAELPARFEQVTELARGGMGRVLVAFDRLHAREVAIKESLSASASAVQRFEREAFLTARLQHPGIVAVYEVARRATGEPYLVMRRVHGEPLKTAIAAATTLEERLRLLPRFGSVVETIAYAHQQGVIHRDLKPANVLLGDFGDTVVIDWGLAKLISEASGAEGESVTASASPPASHTLTAVGSVMGTLAYMSPEQAAGGAVDARTDVYALGAMLYELLSGTPPHTKDTGASAPNARRAAAPLPDSVPTELMTIVGRAMAEQPERRYAEAGALAADLSAFQTGRLVSSHAYSLGALIGRWVRRNRAVLAVATVSLLTLLTLGAVGVRRVLVERDRANREAEASKRVADFMTQMFSVVDPSEARGNAVTAREILDRASTGIENGLGDDPALKARLMKTMGEVYVGLGLYPQAARLLETAATTSASIHGPDDADTLRIESQLATLLFHQSKFKEAEALARSVLERQRTRLGPGAADTLRTLNTLGDVLRDTNQAVEAERLHREAYEARTTLLGPKHRDTLLSLGRLADDIHEQGRYLESGKLFEEVLARRREALGTDDLDTVWAMNGLSGAYQKLGRQAEAEKLDIEAVDVRTRVLGPDHPSRLESLMALGNDHFDREDFVGAEKLYAEVDERRTRVLGPEHMWTLAAENNRANAFHALGRLAEAEALHRRVLEIRTRVLGPDHAHVLLEKQALAAVLRSQKRFAESKALVLEAKADRERVFGVNSRGLAGIFYSLGALATEQGQLDEALGHLESALKCQLSVQDQQHLLADPEFGPLHSHPRWAAIMEQVNNAQVTTR